jgi:MFS family permease
VISPQRRIQFYSKGAKGFLLRILTIDDVSFWGAEALVNVVLALFIVTQIRGAGAIEVGFALTIRQLVLAAMSIPMGRILDRHKGLLDELYFLSLSGLLSGLSYFLLSFSGQIWQLYVLMGIVGAAHAINIAAWRTLFYSSIDQNERGETIGAYQTIMSVAGALLVGIGGILAENFGYRVIILIIAGMTTLGGFLPLLLKKVVTLGENTDIIKE